MRIWYPHTIFSMAWEKCDFDFSKGTIYHTRLDARISSWSEYPTKLINFHQKLSKCAIFLLWSLRRVRESGPDRQDASSGDRLLSKTLMANAANWSKPGSGYVGQFFAIRAMEKQGTIRKRFLNNGKAYLRFITNPQTEPTNNRMEQAIRQVVNDCVASQKEHETKKTLHTKTILATYTT